MPQYSLKQLITIILSLSIFRLIFLYLNLGYIDLYMDESYYWGWAQSFEFGYYSKPPMVAWLIMATTSLLGDSELAIKIGSILVYPITTIVVYKIALELFDAKSAFYSGLVFFTLPSIWLSSMIISTDVVLLLFWSLTILFFIKALKYEELRYWVLAGVFAGLGLLSKYNMILFLFSVFTILSIFKEYRKHLKQKELYITMAVAVVVFLPNLLWQYNNDFISFAHTSEISQMDRELFHPNKMFEFLGAQFGVFGPILFATLLIILFKYKSLSHQQKILFWFSVPFLIFITTLSLLSRAFANWAAPTYVAATIIVVAYLVYNKQDRLIKASIIIHTLLAIIIYSYHPTLTALDIKLTSKKYDPFKRVRGWQEAGDKLSLIKAKYPNTKILFSSRLNMSQLTYYIKPHPFDAVIFNHKKLNQNHYHLKTNLNNHIGESFIYISSDKNISTVARYFERNELLDNFRVVLYEDFNRDFYIYRVEKFKGY
jgi:4-amino-4-deoxy-L-arabinose transferase-like glycosyltransferase